MPRWHLRRSLDAKKPRVARGPTRSYWRSALLGALGVLVGVALATTAEHNG